MHLEEEMVGEQGVKGVTGKLRGQRSFDANLYGDGGLALSSSLRYSSIGLRMSVTLKGVEWLCRELC